MAKKKSKFSLSSLYKHKAWYKKAFAWVKKTRIPLWGGLPIRLVAINFWRNMTEESVSNRAAVVAFNMFLAIFPAFIALFTLLPYVPVPKLADEIVDFMQEIMPSSAFDTIDETLRDVLQTRRGGLLSIGLIAAIYFASNGVFSLMSVLNSHMKRSYWRQKLISFWITLWLGGIIIIGVSLIVGLQFSENFITKATTLERALVADILSILQWILLGVLVCASNLIMYRHGDERSERWRYVLPGAIMATFLTAITSYGYTYYVGHFAHYNKLYGSLGAMIITMLWLNFNAMGIIIGHDFNRALINVHEQKRWETEDDEPSLQ